MITVGDSMPVNFTSDDSSSAAFREVADDAAAHFVQRTGRRHVLLDVHAYRRAGARRARQPEDNSGTVLHEEADALVFGLIEPSTGSKYSKTSAVAILLPCTTLPVLLRRSLGHGGEHGLGLGLVDALVVVSAVVISAVGRPVVLDYAFDGY